MYRFTTALFSVGAAVACNTVIPALAQDTYPMGMLAFFNQAQCPANWSLAADINNNSLNGYFVVPFYQLSAGRAGTTLTTLHNVPAMENSEVRTHNHGFASSIWLPEVKYAGVSGCTIFGCNKDTSHDDAMGF